MNNQKLQLILKCLGPILAVACLSLTDVSYAQAPVIPNKSDQASTDATTGSNTTNNGALRKKDSIKSQRMKVLNKLNSNKNSLNILQRSPH